MPVLAGGGDGVKLDNPINNANDQTHSPMSSPSSALPFEGAHLKLDQAKRHMHTLTIATARYAADNPAKIEQKTMPNGTPSISIMTPNVPVPADIALLVGDILHNIRSSLDLMMSEVARIRNKPDIKFPFAANKAALEIILNKETSKLGEDIVDLVRSLKPFKGGNLALRALHDLDIIDKHKLLLPISRQQLYFLCSFSVRYLGTDGNMHLISRKMAPGIFEEAISGVPGSLYQYYIHLPENYDLIAITFGKSMPFAGKPVFDVVEQMIKLVQDIVKQFEAHCTCS